MVTIDRLNHASSAPSVKPVAMSNKDDIKPIMTNEPATMEDNDVEIVVKRQASKSRGLLLSRRR